MTTFLLVHGAFRGGWAFGGVRRQLHHRGHDAFAPSLRGMGERREPPGTEVRLADWVDELAALLDAEDASDVVAVGHSQGGMVISALASRHPERLAGLVYLDAPVARPGDRGVDLLGGPRLANDQLPPASTWLEPTPIDADAGLPADLTAWVNRRLCATPLGPSLDVVLDEPSVLPARYAFCSATPLGYPSTVTRARFDAGGTPYRLLDAPHDVAIAQPELVAALLEEFADGMGLLSR